MFKLLCILDLDTNAIAYMAIVPKNYGSMAIDKIARDLPVENHRAFCLPLTIDIYQDQIENTAHTIFQRTTLTIVDER